MGFTARPLKTMVCMINFAAICQPQSVCSFPVNILLNQLRKSEAVLYQTNGVSLMQFIQENMLDEMFERAVHCLSVNNLRDIKMDLHLSDMDGI
jgi:hypothetical protein